MGSRTWQSRHTVGSDILLEVSLLSSYLCQPREGHLEAVYSIFAYLEKHIEATMAFDNKPPRIVKDAIHWIDWRESVYGDVEEEIPINCPKPQGNAVTMTCFVDANHTGNKVTRRSQTGFIIYLNLAPLTGSHNSRIPVSRRHLVLNLWPCGWQ
jgi:hypothetical protein